MKKMKLYMLLLLVPLILMGCIEKGKPASGINVEVDSLGGYTWEQLQNMIDNPDNKNEGSRLANNILELKSLKNVASIAGDSYKISKIDNLVKILEQKVETPIRESFSTFNYSTALSSVNSADNELTSILNIKTLSQLEEIKAELDLWAINFPGDSKLYNMSKSLEITISTIKNRKTINPFYASSYRLYYQYENNIGKSSNVDYLKNTYGIDVINLSKDPMINAALIIIKEEIAQLSTNQSPIPLDPAEKAFILKSLEDIRDTYVKYLERKVNFSDTSTLRTVLRNYEAGLLAAESPSMAKSSMDKIDNIYTQLDAYTSTDINKLKIAEKYMEHIDAYKRLNTSYDKNDYSAITSKVVNIVEELEYLNKNGADDLFTILRLTKPW